jgi:nicotinamide-nucleotide amidase
MINTHKIAILSTGDEITNGDILNSNSQEIARQLFNLGMNVGLHITAPDDKHAITEAIHYLLKDHDALIMTGGLGPTSDDVTRYALSAAVNSPMVFDEPTWENIRSRLAKIGYLTPPENNRQQALFPEGSTIIPNHHGTAAGCYLTKNEKTIFMLPGPPFECMPMMEIAIDTLTKKGFYQTLYRDHWFLFSVSEGQIANELDPLMKDHDCVLGYRLCYPYLEVKLLSRNKNDFQHLKKLVEERISGYLLRDGKKFISDILKERVVQDSYLIGICDQATGGEFESIIKTPKTFPFFIFANNKSFFTSDVPLVEIGGLEDYWCEKKTFETNINCIVTLNGHQTIKNQTIPFRGRRVKQYAVEWVSHQIINILFP